MTTLLADDVVRHQGIEPPKRSFDLIPKHHPGLAAALAHRDFRRERCPADLRRMANHGELDRDGLANLEIAHDAPSMKTQTCLDVPLGRQHDGTIMMVRTQISLNSELHTQVRARAAALGVSLAEYMRRLVDRDLADSPRSIDRSIVFDLGTSGTSDIASEKDRMIAEATAAGKLRHSAAS